MMDALEIGLGRVVDLDNAGTLPDKLTFNVLIRKDARQRMDAERRRP